MPTPQRRTAGPVPRPSGSDTRFEPVMRRTPTFTPPAETIVRGQSPDKTQETAFSLPPPEALGIDVAPEEIADSTLPAKVDWNAIHARLRAIGAVAFQVRRVDDRFTASFAVPSGNGRTRFIEATAADELEAALAALRRAEGR